MEDIALTTNDIILLLIITGVVLLITSIIISIADSWIRVKDFAYRLEKYLHLKNDNPTTVIRLFMRFLRFISKY